MDGQNRTVPIIFSVDDNYTAQLGVAMRSIVKHTASPERLRFFVLCIGLSERNKQALSAVAAPVPVEFLNVYDRIVHIADRLLIRDYYTATTYFRFFIPELFPSFDKVLYLDADICLSGDVTALFDIDLGENYLGAVQEEVMQTVPEFGDYVETVVGIPRESYFNAGVLSMNLEALRKAELERTFVRLLTEKKFPVTQDQDYLNAICYKKVRFFDLTWNKMPGFLPFSGTPSLVHYKMHYRPWIAVGVQYEELFWDSAKETPFYGDLKKMRDGYTPEKKRRDEEVYRKLVELAKRETIKNV